MLTACGLRSAGPTDTIPYTDTQLASIGQARDTLLACDATIHAKAPDIRLGYFRVPYLAFRNCAFDGRYDSAAQCNPSEYLGEMRYKRMLTAIDTLSKLRIIGAWYADYAPDSSDLVLIIDTNYRNYGDGRYLSTHTRTGFDLQDKRGKFLYLRDQL
ncbi:hypothetical protein [Hymenobacter edaphi]|uniref:hypothetical protein n=1 Tax=Hymenobacter edaphi TaxID=2211146 RepID=UPI001057E1FF|nr:hypothetical protein [Hymenobacter edaphi]